MAKVGRKPAGNEKYFLESRFSDLIKEEVDKRRSSGKKVIQADIYDELAEYVGCSSGMLSRIKKGMVNPSILTALKISEYFNMKVEDIWFSSENTKYHDDRERCSEQGCKHTVFAKELCFRHYGKMKKG